MKENIEFVAALEIVGNGCPIHDGGVYYMMEQFASLDEVKKYAIENINEKHVMELLSVSTEDVYTIEYVPESHMYIGIILKKNNEIIARAIEDEDINLVWRSIDGDN